MQLDYIKTELKEWESVKKKNTSGSRAKKVAKELLEKQKNKEA